MRMFSKACSLVVSSLPRCSSSAPAVRHLLSLSSTFDFYRISLCRLGSGLGALARSSGTRSIAAARCNNRLGVNERRRSGAGGAFAIRPLGSRVIAETVPQRPCFHLISFD